MNINESRRVAGATRLEITTGGGVAKVVPLREPRRHDRHVTPGKVYTWLTRLFTGQDCQLCPMGKLTLMLETFYHREFIMSTSLGCGCSCGK